MNWLTFANCLLNLDNVISIDKKNENEIEIFVASGTSLTSKGLTFNDKQARDDAFDEITKRITAK